MTRMYSDRLVTAANTANQTVFTKQWNLPVTIKAMKIETSDTLGGDLTVRGYLGGEIFLYDSDAQCLEEADWIPVNAGPPTLRAAFKVECDNSHATNTPDIVVIILVELGVEPPNNLPWITGQYFAASSADVISKEFDKDAVWAWWYANVTGGTLVAKVGDTRANGDDEGFIDEPRTPTEGIAYPVRVPANVTLKFTTAAATGTTIIAVQKPW